MRQAGLQGRPAKRGKKTTIPDPATGARADRIRRDFTADASKVNTRWCGNITYIATLEGCDCLVAVQSKPRSGRTAVIRERPLGFAVLPLHRARSGHALAWLEHLTRRTGQTVQRRRPDWQRVFAYP